MTTIAYDGKILAADGRRTADNYLLSDNIIKLFRIQADGLKYEDTCDTLLWGGLTGHVDKLLQFMYYLQDSDQFVYKEFEECYGIILGENRVYHVEKGFLLPYPLDTKLTDGSGCQYALAAMGFGLNAMQAVRQASKYDMSTGGNITYIENNEMKSYVETDHG